MVGLWYNNELFFEHIVALVFVNYQKYSSGKHELWFRIPQETSCYFKRQQVVIQICYVIHTPIFLDATFHNV